MPTTRDLETQAEADRAQIALTLEQLRSRMSTGKLVDQAVAYARPWRRRVHAQSGRSGEDEESAPGGLDHRGHRMAHGREDVVPPHADMRLRSSPTKAPITGALPTKRARRAARWRARSAQLHRKGLPSAPAARWPPRARAPRTRRRPPMTPCPARASAPRTRPRRPVIRSPPPTAQRATRQPGDVDDGRHGRSDRPARARRARPRRGFRAQRRGVQGATQRETRPPGRPWRGRPGHAGAERSVPAHRGTAVDRRRGRARNRSRDRRLAAAVAPGRRAHGRDGDSVKEQAVGAARDQFEHLQAAGGRFVEKVRGEAEEQGLTADSARDLVRDIGAKVGRRRGGERRRCGRNEIREGTGREQDGLS